MKQSLSLFLMVLVMLIPGCVAPHEQYSELEARTIRVLSTQSILIEADYGELSILPSEDDRVTVEGEVLSAEELEYRIDSTEDQVLIKILAHRRNFSTVPLRAILRLPQPIRVKVQTEGASVLGRDLQGELEVASTSGNITLEQITGRMTLRSNRGSITVRESSGDVSAVGNYGAMTIVNVSGTIAFSTIMGNVVFRGPIQMDDDVHIETDHGSVSVGLSDRSSMRLQVRSTSGEVACMLPGIDASIRTCEGEFRLGGGTLSIRTVSGAVTVQVMP